MKKQILLGFYLPLFILSISTHSQADTTCDLKDGSDLVLSLDEIRSSIIGKSTEEIKKDLSSLNLKRLKLDLSSKDVNGEWNQICTVVRFSGPWNSITSLGSTLSLKSSGLSYFKDVSFVGEAKKNISEDVQVAIASESNPITLSYFPSAFAMQYHHSMNPEGVMTTEYCFLNLALTQLFCLSDFRDGIIDVYQKQK